jgi:UDP-N-acetylglucosamine acyltransferase
MKIHPTAIIDSSVKLGLNVEIGAYAVISGNVTIDDNCKIYNHASITSLENGGTTIGKGNIFFPFCSVGAAPQDLKFHNEPSFTEIGNNNTFRESITVHSGTEGGGYKTIIGSNGLFMAGAHIAHDCHVGNHVILANNVSVAGHVIVGDYVIIGGHSAVHQFVRIGNNAMIGGMSAIESDIIPYGNAFGERASLQGLNLIGLKRKNFSRESISMLRDAFDEIFDKNAGETISKRIVSISDKYKDNTEVMQIIDFIKSADNRAICQPKK